MNTQRFKEFMEGMNSFGKTSYHKSELLNEMFALQQEIVALTFNDEHAAMADLKIWDVEKHLEQLNEELNHAADKELQRFMDGSKTLCNLIKAEIYGNRGEYKTFKALEYLHSQNRILKNVELNDGELHAELDAVVITPKCITIVEVKNTGKNIFIDEDGNYYRTGEFLKWDCNIVEKMALKENLLRKVLEDVGYAKLQIRSIIVFTNNRIEVQNKFPQIRISFVSQLAHIIDSCRSNEVLSLDEMNQIQSIIESAICKNEYPFEFDVQQYKTDFANLMVALEYAKESQKEMKKEVIPVMDMTSGKVVNKLKKLVCVDDVKPVLTSRQLRHVGSTVTAVVVTIISSLIATNKINKEGI